RLRCGRAPPSGANRRRSCRPLFAHSVPPFFLCLVLVSVYSAARRSLGGFLAPRAEMPPGVAADTGRPPTHRFRDCALTGYGFITCTEAGEIFGVGRAACSTFLGSALSLRPRDW